MVPGMIHTLPFYRLPEPLGLRRDLPRRAEDPDHPGWVHYDFHTLIYGAVALDGGRRVRIYLPRTLNLWPLVAEAELRLDGRKVDPPRHLTNRRYETLDIANDGPQPSEVTLASPVLGRIAIPVARSDDAVFAGRRVLYTMLRNERLDWVRDWVLFHAREQGANAVLIADNGSTDYDSATLRDTLASVPGLDVAEVVSVPLPFGPRHFAKGVDDGKYLQTTMINVMRDSFLARAEAVLNLDVDELLLRREDRSAFAVARRWGYATFRGSWHYAQPSLAPVRHRDHLLHDPTEKVCPTKYVYVPAARLGRAGLSVHSLERINRKFFSANRYLHFLHCHAISTSWKVDRRAHERPGLVEDPVARDAFDRVFG
jgi:hypothetical protein